MRLRKHQSHLLERRKADWLKVRRKPEDCSFRVHGQNDTIHCDLVQQLADFQDVDTRIDAEACAACCKCAVPTAVRPNHVVASLTHAAISHRLTAISPAHDHVQATERLIWLENFLMWENCKRDKSDLRRVSQKWLRDMCHWIRRRTRQPRRIGLLGFNNLKGLGHQNRDLAKWLPIGHWLSPSSLVVADGSQCKANHGAIEEFLHKIDVLLFVEEPCIEHVPRRARELGNRVVCIPNWEWLHPGLKWLKDVDAMICPSQRTYGMLSDWQRRFGFNWELHYCPWPIDCQAIPFRLREKCRQFVFVNGTDQGYPRRRDGTCTKVRRKGIDLVIEAARRLPEIPFTIWSQTSDTLDQPPNVSIRRSALTNVDLYQEGDVCLQLSRWEGLGLPLLECQAAGMPLITVDEPPMNEHNPLSVVPVVDYESLELWSRRWIAAPRIALDEIVKTLEYWIDKDISSASYQAREFIEREHSWQSQGSALLDLIRSTS